MGEERIYTIGPLSVEAFEEPSVVGTKCSDDARTLLVGKGAGIEVSGGGALAGRLAASSGLADEAGFADEFLSP